MCDRCDVGRALREVESFRRPPDSEWFWVESGTLMEHWDVRNHPVLRTWADHGTDPDELLLLADEGDHVALATAALAETAANKADGDLGDRLDDAVLREHELAGAWRAFARSSGWSPTTAWYFGADPSPQTRQLVRAWLGEPGRPLALDLVTLRVAMTTQARLADALLAPLARESETVPRWFHMRGAEDDDLAAALDGALEAQHRGPHVFEVLRQAEASLRAHWHFFDVLAGPRHEALTETGR